MADLLNTSVLDAFSQICLLEHDIRQTLHFFEPRLNAFENFEEYFFLIHDCIWYILTSIDGDTNQFFDLGLRVCQESWFEPPVDAPTALEEVVRIMNTLESLFTSETRDLPVFGFYPRMETYINNAREQIHEMHGNLVDQLNMRPQQNPDVASGATEEQINAIPVHIAINEDVGQACSICVSNFIAGEQIKILQCSHRYHKDCIETWLRQRATCPMDRSRAFPN